MLTPRELAPFVELVRARNPAVPMPERAIRLIETRDVARVLDEVRAPMLMGDTIDQATADVERWVSDGYRIVTILDADYPERLRTVRESPVLLFSSGQFDGLRAGVSVVGSRKPTSGEEAAAAEVSATLVNAEFAVISGLALGIDTAAHRAAIDSGGRTVAVMGTGLEHTYPAANARLRARIENSGGAVLSQFFPEFGGSKQSFPMRNAVMSGLGIATVVIAAGEHSGTRSQVRFAIGHGRPVVLTPRVATETTWGREYAALPSVHVADDPQDVARIVSELRTVADPLALFP